MYYYTYWNLPKINAFHYGQAIKYQEYYGVFLGIGEFTFDSIPEGYLWL